MKQRSFAILVVTLFLSVTAFATAQYPDKIFYEGKEYMLHSNPMEAYFARYPDKKPKSGMRSTALWRGYIASFEIKDGQVLLKDIEIMVKTPTTDKEFERGWKSVLKDVIQDSKPLKIDWFTGLLVLPEGKIVDYVHMGYGSTYEKYTLLEISAGDFKKVKSFSHEEYSAFRERQFQAFKKTDEYKNLYNEIRKRDRSNTDEFIESFLRSFITNYTSKFLVD